MKSFAKTSLLFFVGSALCIPLEEGTSELGRRAPITIHDLPSSSITCGSGDAIRPSEMRLAIEKAVDLDDNNDTHGEDEYPRVFSDRDSSPIQFNPMCKAQLLESPILERAGDPHDGSKTDRNKGDLRAVFEIITKGSEARFCGLMIHKGTAKGASDLTSSPLAKRDSPVIFTPAAQDAIGRILNEDPEQYIRLAVTGSTCHNLSYMMIVDNVIRDDLMITLPNGYIVLVDNLSLRYVTGMTVDYVDNGPASGFVFNNPNCP